MCIMFYGQSNIYVPASVNGLPFATDTTSPDLMRLPSFSRLSGESGVSSFLDGQLTPGMLAAYGLGNVLNGVARPTPLHPGVIAQRAVTSGWPVSWTGIQVPQAQLPATRMFTPSLWPAGLNGFVGCPPGVGEGQKRPVSSPDSESPAAQSTIDIPMPPIIPTKEYPWIFHSCHPDILR